MGLRSGWWRGLSACAPDPPFAHTGGHQGLEAGMALAGVDRENLIVGLEAAQQFDQFVHFHMAHPPELGRVDLIRRGVQLRPARFDLTSQANPERSSLVGMSGMQAPDGLGSGAMATSPRCSRPGQQEKVRCLRVGAESGLVLLSGGGRRPPIPYGGGSPFHGSSSARDLRLPLTQRADGARMRPSGRSTTGTAPCFGDQSGPLRVRRAMLLGSSGVPATVLFVNMDRR